MGDSRPPAAVVDLVDSYARRVGADVEIVLAQPELGLPDGAVVFLGRQGVRLETSATLDDAGSASRLVLRVPRNQLSDGTYRVRLKVGDDVTPLGCRLLVQGERPVVLLWGDQALESRKPRPHPRGRGKAQGPAAAPTPAQRAKSVVRPLVRRGRALVNRGSRPR